MAAKPIVISILANSSKAQAELNQTATLTQKLGSSFRRMALPVGGAIAAIAGFRAVKGFLTDAVAEAREAQKVTARTNNVLKTTGGVANISAKQVGNLSTAISNKVGVDDEAIQSGSNLLLTFTKIRNEAGKGNDIFNQATKAAVDLSAAGFGSITSASKQLGKALNDPIKGVTALAKSGVTFTDQQKKQIAAMVKSGNVLGAQKIILGEVQRQVGGAAAAQATAGEKLRVTIDNIKESVGTKLLPILDTVATYLATNLPKWMTVAGDAFAKVKTFLAPVVKAFTDFTDGSGKAGSKFTQFSNTVKSVWASVKSIFQDGVVIVTALWGLFGSTILNNLKTTFTNVLTILQGAFTVIKGIFDVVAGILTGDWSRVWTGIKEILGGAVQVLVGLVREMWNRISTLFTLAVITLKATFSGLFGALKSLAAVGWNALKSAFDSAWNALKSATSTGVTKVVTVVKALPGKIVGAFKGAGSLLKGVGGDIVRGLIKGISALKHAVTDALLALLPGPLKKFAGKLGISSPSKVFHGFGENITQGLINGIKSESHALDTTLNKLSARVADTSFALGVDAKGKPTMIGALPLAKSGGDTYNITVQLDSNMTEIEMGVQIQRAINAAKKAGATV